MVKYNLGKGLRHFFKKHAALLCLAGGIGSISKGCSEFGFVYEAGLLLMIPMRPSYLPMWHQRASMSSPLAFDM